MSKITAQVCVCQAGKAVVMVRDGVWRQVRGPVRFQLSRGLDEVFRRAGVDDPKGALDALAEAGELVVCVEVGCGREG